MTYDHLLLRLYSFGAILIHSCCTRLQPRLRMHTHCTRSNSNVPKPFTSVLSLMQCWQCAYLISWSHWVFACLLKIPVCPFKLVRFTGSATHTRADLDCPWASEEVEERYKWCWVKFNKFCSGKCLACDVLGRGYQILSEFVRHCQVQLSSTNLSYAQCGLSMLSCICVQSCAVIASPQSTHPVSLSIAYSTNNMLLCLAWQLHRAMQHQSAAGCLTGNSKCHTW